MMRWPSSPLPRWVIKRMDERIVEGMFDAQMEGRLDEQTDRAVNWVLFEIRLRRALVPYIALLKSFFYIFKLAWEVAHGKYWRSTKKVHGGSNAPSGAGSGAGVAPVAQFTGYAGGITAGPYVTGAGSGVAQAPVPIFKDAGIKAGEVVAYRCWKLRGDGLLRSVVMDFIWQPGEIAQGDAAGGEGIYAFKSVLMLHEYGSVGMTSDIVTGMVDLWGDVYEHERGYRAQYAAIASIDESPYYDAAALRKLYGLNKKRKKK